MAYTEVYDYNLLDDLHNLFPELLYDNVIFPSESSRVIGWVRYRMANLFPQTYRQERVAYEQTRAAAQRDTFDDWMFLLNRPIATPPPQLRMRDYGPPVPAVQWPSSHLAHLLASPATVSASGSVAGWGGANRYTTPIRQTNHIIHANLGHLLNTFFDAVPISATAAEINAASTILAHSEVSQETICAVCQDHDVSPSGAGSPTATLSRTASESSVSGATATTTATAAAPTVTATPVPWRKLNRCGHLFHAACVDNWFARNAHCPVCRADIRDVAAHQGATEDMHI
jgi:hypothetical protein